MERDTIQTTRALVQTVDSQLLRAETAVLALSGSRYLAERDFAGFHRQATELLRKTGIGAYVAVLDQAGNNIVNTLRPYGEPLPPHGNQEHLRPVFESGRPFISNLYIGSISNRPRISVYAPVKENGRVVYALNVGIDSELLGHILEAQHLPPGWLVSIVDGAGTIAARNRSAEQYVGEKAPPDVLRGFTAAPEGSIQSVTKEGIEALVVFSRSPVTGWRVVAAIPSQSLQAPFLRNLAFLGTGLAALFLVGLALARLLGTRISGSVHALAASAFHLEAGEEAPAPRVHFREAAEAAQAIEMGARLLQDRERNLRQLIATLPGLVWTATGEGAVDFVSRQWRDYTGTTLESQLGTGFLGAIHPEDRDKVGKLWREAIANRASYHTEYRLRRRDGVYRWFKARGTPVTDDDGQVSRWLGVATDIDDLKRAQEALLDSEQRYRALFNNRTSAIAHLRIVTDADGRPVNYYVEAVNDTYERILGLRRQEVEGRLATEIAPNIREFDVNLVAVLGRVGLEGGEAAFEMLFPPTGQWLSIYAYSPKPGECTAMFTDVSAQKRTEAEIQRLNAELEERVQQRTAELKHSNEALLRSNMELQRFAHAAAHDLQTPLRSIAGFTQLLQREIGECVDERADEWLTLVIDNTRRLQVLIEELLDYARLDARARPFEVVDMEAVFEQVLASLSALIEEGGAEVTRGDLPTLLADRTQMAQLLQNLVENGIKYNRSKPPRVAVTWELQGNDDVFAIKDNGIGVDPKHHQRIFEIFRRLHTYTEIPGTGIGLAICQRIVERHGGRMWMESQPGRGSVFYFSLPARRPAAGQ
ncbi:MAG TPA: ATP-binding protein [Rhodocyclaceae bacterium]|nr:ATP-binding protein [Rhodocyclaceae bacterium]